MTDNSILEKVRQVPDSYRDELLYFVDYLLYKDQHDQGADRRVSHTYDFGSYKLGLPEDVSLAENLETVRHGERY
jgi:hypothetical protein